MRRKRTSKKHRVIAELDLPDWWRATMALQNPIEVDFHLFALLSGIHPKHLHAIPGRNVDIWRKSLTLFKPSGEIDYVVPLSRPLLGIILRSLTRFTDALCHEATTPLPPDAYGLDGTWHKYWREERILTYYRNVFHNPPLRTAVRKSSTGAAG
jgi:hypothetical protein